ncbi:unnamed protein product [Closterium sp. NIES-54]
MLPEKLRWMLPSQTASHPGPPFVFGPSAPQPLGLSVPGATDTTTAATATATAATTAPACCTAMASLRVLAFDHEGRPVQFDTWLDDLRLYLLSDYKDSVSLFDFASGAAPAPPATADSATHSQWLTRDATARLAIRNHLPLVECAHFRQHRTAHALYAAVVARYSSPATATLGRLLLPYLFPKLSAFATVEDLVSHLRTSDARYRATVLAEDHFLSLDPTSLTIDLLEQHLLAAEISVVAVGAARGTPRLPFFEGCSPPPLAPSCASAAAADVSVVEDVGAASASAKCFSNKGMGCRGGGGGSGGGGGVSGSGGLVLAPGLSAPAATATAAAATAAPTATAAPAYHATMASLRLLAFDHKAQALYDAVVARYSSSATAALGRLLLPYLFPELSAFATVADLVSHLRASDARYHAADLAEFLDKNQPPMFITLYFIVTRLPNSLRSDRDHFLSLIPTSLTVDLLEQHLLAAETSAVAVGAARGTPCPPFFEGCSPSPLAPSYASAVAADVSVAEDVGVASASAKHRSSKGKGGKGGGGGSGSGGGGSGSSGGGSSGGGGGGGTGGGSGGSGGGGGGSSGSGGCGGSETGGDGTGETYAEGDCYGCVPPDPVIAAAALGASEFGTLPGTTPARALHTFTLDSSASRCFFRDSTTLTPLPAPIPVILNDPSGGPVVARSSTVLPCPAVPSGSLSVLHLPSFSTNLVSSAALQDAIVTTTTPGGQRVSICMCTQTGRHLATFTRPPWSSMYTLATEPPQVAVSALVSASGQVVASCSCRLLSHQTLLWHHCLGHPSLPRLRGMHSRLLNAAPHSSSFPPTTAPLQTLHMDVRGPAHVSGQSRERYFLLVVYDYTRYTTVFALRTVRLQLRERFGQDLLVLRLHPDRGGEFSSNLLRDFCHGEGVLPSFMLPGSPQQNGIAEHRIGLVMEVARTSMIHAAAPHFRWPFAVWYAAHQLNLWPCVSLPETLPTLRWTEEVGDASVFRGPAPSGVSQVDPLLGTVPVEGAVGSSAAPGAASGGAESEGAESGGAVARGASLSGGPAGTSPRLSPQQLREWFVRHARLRSGAPGAGDAGDAGAGGAGVTAGAIGTGGTAAAGPGGARTRGAGAAGTGGVGGARAGDPTEPGAAGAGGSCAGGAGAGGAGSGGAGVGGTGAGGAGAARAGAVDPGAGGAGGTVRPRPYFVPLLQQVLGVPSSTALTPPLLCPPPDQSQPPLQPASPLPSPSPFAEQFGGLTERREHASRPVLPVRTARRVPRSRPPPVPGTHAMALRPSFESAAASALVAELLDIAAAYRLDYATALVAESASANPPSVRGERALGMDVLEDRVSLPCCLPLRETRMLQTSRPGALTQRRLRGVDYFETFSPTPKMTTLRVLLHVAAQRDYELHSLDFSTAFLQGSMYEEIWLRCPPGFTESFPAGTQWSLRRPVYGLRQAPREWRDTLRTTLAPLGFAPTTADPSLFLRTDTSLPPFYVLVYVDDLVFATADTEALTLVKSELQKRHTCTDLGELHSYLGSQITRDRARRTITLTQSHMVHQVLERFGFQFSSPQPTPLSTSHSLSAPPADESVEPSGPYPELVGCLISSCEAEIYAATMAAQELPWLTYLLTDLGEQPRSPPILYIDNKAMIALCQEH